MPKFQNDNKKNHQDFKQDYSVDADDRQLIEDKGKNVHWDILSTASLYVTWEQRGQLQISRALLQRALPDKTVGPQSHILAPIITP